MLPLIVFSHLRWDFVYQRPQHLLSRLAAMGRPVLFVEEPVQGTATPYFERFAPQAGIEVLRPHTPSRAPGFADEQLPYIAQLLVDYLLDFGIDDYDVWFYTPLALPLLDELDPRLVVYDCMDELASFRHSPPQMLARERSLLGRADVVLCGGPSLHDAKRVLHPRAVCLPSAVDIEHFAPQGAARTAAAEDPQAHLPRPRLGFYGVVDERLDIDLIAALADADTDWQVVMVGPVAKISAADLPQRPNLHWIGQERYERLPLWVAGWDVCLVPFALNEATRFISPTKTLEYMAADKPVVSTPIKDVARLYGEAVAIAHDHEAFIRACRRALEESALERRLRASRAQQIVRHSTWDAAARTVHQLLIEAARQADAQETVGAATATQRASPLSSSTDSIEDDARGALQAKAVGL
jgi:glycosyltransferase involved in cell wall biosynthesis